MSIRHQLTAAKRRVFFGWWIVSAAFLVQTLHSSLMFLSQGAYMIEMQATFGWSKSSISGAFSMLRLESGLLGPIQGWMIDRYGPRLVMRIGAVLFGGGFLLLSQIQELWHFYVAFGMIALGSSLGGFLTIHTTIAQWFIRKRSRAMSFSSMGFSVGAIAAPLVAWSLVTIGWRETAVISGVIILVVGLAGAQLFRGRPEDYGMVPDGDIRQAPTELAESGTDKTAQAPTEINFTVKEAMRDRSFWYVAMGHGMALLVTATVPVHLVPYLVEQNGWSPAATAFVFPAIMVMQIIGQVSGGIVGDLYSRRMVAAAAMLGHGAAFIILAFSAAPLAVGVSVALHGISWGARGPQMMAIRADYFGRRNLGLIAGWSNAITVIGSVIGPVYAGVMFDWQGDYTVAFWTIGLATALSTVLFLLARKPPPPARYRDL